MNLDNSRPPVIARNQGPGLFNVHLDLLEGHGLSDEGHATESHRVAEIRKSGLPLLVPNGPRGLSGWYFWSPVVAFSSIVLMLVLTQNPSDDFNIKGQTKIQLILEHKGARSLLSDETALLPGDRVNAEIISGEAVSAFMIVRDQHQKSLWTPKEVLVNSLDLDPGKKGFFKVAVELDGANQGEELTVYSCSAKGVSQFASDKLKFVTELCQNFKDKSLEVFIAKQCDVKTRKLRATKGGGN